MLFFDKMSSNTKDLTDASRDKQENEQDTSRDNQSTNTFDNDDDGDEQDANEVLDTPSHLPKRKPKESSTTLQAKWDEMFARLVEFRGKKGHCLVPNRYSEDPQLGSWVSTQRRQYKILISGGSESTPMTPERANRLMSIGFKWETKDPRHVPWEKRYNELVQFVEKYGHAQVPIGWEDNVQLSNWVSTQRQEYKLLRKGRSSRLTNERIKLLDNIGFVWEAQRGGPRRRRKSNAESSQESGGGGGGSSGGGMSATAAAVAKSDAEGEVECTTKQTTHLKANPSLLTSKQRNQLGKGSGQAAIEASAMDSIIAQQQQQQQHSNQSTAAARLFGGNLSGAAPSAGLTPLELSALAGGPVSPHLQQAHLLEQAQYRLLASRGLQQNLQPWAIPGPISARTFPSALTQGYHSLGAPGFGYQGAPGMGGLGGPDVDGINAALGLGALGRAHPQLNNNNDLQGGTLLSSNHTNTDGLTMTDQATAGQDNSLSGSSSSKRKRMGQIQLSSESQKKNKLTGFDASSIMTASPGGAAGVTGYPPSLQQHGSVNSGGNFGVSNYTSSTANISTRGGLGGGRRLLGSESGRQPPEEQQIMNRQGDIDPLLGGSVGNSDQQQNLDNNATNNS